MGQRPSLWVVAPRPTRMVSPRTGLATTTYIAGHRHEGSLHTGDTRSEGLRRAAVAGAAAVLCYANAIGQGFVNLDDTLYLTQNPRMLDHSLAGVWAILSPQHAWQGLAVDYLPLRDLLYWTSVAAFGLTAWPLHLLSVALHALNAALVVRVGERLGVGPFGALAAGLLFAVHPVHVAAVAWVAALKDPLYTVFCLSAVLVFVEREKPRTQAKVLALATLGFVSKAITVALGPLLWLVDRSRAWRAPSDGPGWVESLLAVVPIGVLSVLFAGHALHVATASESVVADEGWSVGGAILMSTWCLVLYLSKLLLPLGLQPLYIIEPITSLADVRAIGGLVVCAALCAAAVGLRRRVPIVALGLGWFVIVLLPVLNIVPQRVEAADHYQYLPSVGPLLIAGWLLGRLPGRHRFAALSVLVVVLSALTLSQNRIWGSNIALWTHMSDQAGADERPWVWNNLGGAYAEQGERDLAAQYWTRAVEVGGDTEATGPAHSNLAGWYRDRGQLDRARAHALTASRVLPADPEVWRKLATVEERSRNWAAAADALQEVVARQPRAAEGWFALGINRQRADQAEQAAEAFEHAVALDGALCEKLARFLDDGRRGGSETTAAHVREAVAARCTGP